MVERYRSDPANEEKDVDGEEASSLFALDFSFDSDDHLLCLRVQLTRSIRL